MPSLADRPEIIGFFSYSRDDDRDSEGALSMLRRRIQNELRGLLGRSELTLRLFQDAEAIPSGTFWEREIGTAIEQSIFFIPIVTPRVVRSEHCREEFHKFLERERALARNDLVFPIVYIEVGELQDERAWRGHPVLEHIGARQYVDWCDYRFEPDSPGFRRAIAMFARTIAMALRRNIEPLAQRGHEPGAFEPAREGPSGSRDSAIVGGQEAVQTNKDERHAPVRTIESDLEQPSPPAASGSEMLDEPRQRADGGVAQTHPVSNNESAEKQLPQRDREQKVGTAAPSSLPGQTAAGASSASSSSPNLKTSLFKIFSIPEIPFSISTAQASYIIYVLLTGGSSDRDIFLPLFLPQIILYIAMYLVLKSSLSWKNLIYVGYALISIPPSIFFDYIIAVNHVNGLIIVASLTYSYCGLWGIVLALQKFSLKN